MQFYRHLINETDHLKQEENKEILTLQIIITNYKTEFLLNKIS